MTNNEQAFNARIERLEKSVTYRTNRITAILKMAYDKPKATAAYWSTVRVKLDVQYRALEQVYKTWAKASIPQAYRASVASLMVQLNRSKAVAKQATKTYTSLVTSPKTLAYTNALYRDAVQDWLGALNIGQANLNRITRRTQQALVSQAAVDSSVAKALASGNLMNNRYIKTINMSNTLAAQLDAAASIIDGQKYVIAGSSKYTPKYYAEIVSRVKFHEAQATATMQTALSYGTSLVKVSSHNTTSEVCMEHEGRVYSIQGKDSRFPPLTASPPYHPNCLHNLYPMFVESMQNNGTLKQWQAFSAGAASMPPAPSTFVPVSERG